VTGHVVLDAHIEVRTPPIEDSARPFRSQIVQRPDSNAAIGQLVGIVSIVQARPEVVVAADRWAIAILMDNPVPLPGFASSIQLAARRDCLQAHAGREHEATRWRLSRACCRAVTTARRSCSLQLSGLKGRCYA
jgi:hypothetical protein